MSAVNNYDILEPLALYIALGLEPGGFTTKLIHNDPTAVLSAHALLRPHVDQFQTAVNKIVKEYPEIKLPTWKGIINLSDNEIDEYLMRLKLKNSEFDKFIYSILTEDDLQDIYYS